MFLIPDTLSAITQRFGPKLRNFIKAYTRYAICEDNQNTLPPFYISFVQIA